MLLLRFRVENYASFRDEASLTLVQSRLRSSHPVDGSWSDYTNRVAAIYGANASGKSRLLEAIVAARSVIKNSATSPKKRLPREPFRLDEESASRPTAFVFDFVLDAIRYEYGFSHTADAVQEEWLYSFTKGRKRVLFERGRDTASLSVGRGLRGGEATLQKATGVTELVLSKGALLKNEQLLAIWNALTGKIVVTRFGETDREGRLRAVISDLVDGSLELEDLRLMLKVADVGIAGAEVAEGELDPRAAKVVRALLDLDLGEEEKSDEASEPVDENEVERILREANRRLQFEHVGVGERLYSMPMTKQSTGTLTWLSLAAPAIKALRHGGVFAVDEIDASLHPQLAQVMIQMFKDPAINSRHAQLIFTTHDTYFMSPTSDVRLGPGEVWFVEKNRDGQSEVFSLEDFPVRGEDNFSRRYLHGRYGAVPSVAPAFLTSLVNKELVGASLVGSEG